MLQIHNISVLGFKFDDFEQLPLGREAFDVSPDWVRGGFSASGPGWTTSRWATDCRGDSWQLRLCPDDRPDGSDLPMVSFLLEKEEEQEDSQAAKVMFSIVLRDSKEQVVKEISMASSDICFDCKGFVERSRVLNEDNKILVDGALHVELVIQHEQPVECPRVSSQNMLANNILRLLETSHMADLAFTFPNHRGKIFGHSFILKVNAPVLADLVGETDTISIKDTSFEVFGCVVRYIYGGGPPGKDFICEHGMKIIDAANKFGVVGLKLEAEAMLVHSYVVNITNVVQYYLFACAMNCALLKECAVSVFVARSKDVISSESFGHIQKSPALMTDLMASMADCARVHTVDSRDLTTLPVIALRQLLAEKELDIDGSKEMLISRLESA